MYSLIPKPNSCRLIGLACLDCVSASASQLALACGNIAILDVDRIFDAMYPDRACSPMKLAFVDAYRLIQLIPGKIKIPTLKVSDRMAEAW